MTDLLGNWKPGDPIGYISPQIPECEIPPSGASATRRWCRIRWIWPSARLAIHAMTQNPNPQADFEPY